MRGPCCAATLNLKNAVIRGVEWPATELPVLFSGYSVPGSHFRHCMLDVLWTLLYVRAIMRMVRISLPWRHTLCVRWVPPIILFG